MLYGCEHIGFWVDSRPGRGRERVTTIWEVDVVECGFVVFISLFFALIYFLFLFWLSVYILPQAHPLPTVMPPAQVQLTTYPSRYRYRALKLPRCTRSASPIEHVESQV